ncbi:TetR/AcrR family transcriptional regulator [Pelomonas sp. KK5]|uniref:TetR/AcrR family transcriptional regulator n=1 Tax=Pelomonas sp. KK5 TaxID=1855730 RepID=UPI00097C4F3B|nr:TetR/AcrR family transcriptional regulator [Pelomonas sp. KK5]
MLTDELHARRDHRSETADRKRSETRARILSAALAACAGRLDELPRVEDIVERARLSRGTFYKYFDSMDEVLAALGQDLTRLALLEGERFRTVFTEKWKSTAVVLRVVLTRALLDPNWARFVIRTRGWLRAGLLAEVVIQDLAEGRERGEYHILDDEAALDMLRGLLESCIAALHRGVARPDRYIDGAVHMWLQALGLEPQRCLEGVRMSRDFLGAYVSGELAPFPIMV